jgi:hypothetical protein
MGGRDILYSEYGDSKSLQNVSKELPNYTTSQLSTEQLLFQYFFSKYLQIPWTQEKWMKSVMIYANVHDSDCTIILKKGFIGKGRHKWVICHYGPERRSAGNSGDKD